MKKNLTYIILLITLLLEVILEKHFPIFTLGFLFVFSVLILVNVFLDEKYKLTHSLISITHYILVYVLIIYMTFVAMVFFSYSTTPHTFIMIMLIFLFLASLGFVYIHFYNIYKHIKKVKSVV